MSEFNVPVRKLLLNASSMLLKADEANMKSMKKFEAFNNFLSTYVEQNKNQPLPEDENQAFPVSSDSW